MLHCRFVTSSEYALDFEYASVLNIAGFWICQGSEYAGVLNTPLVLNISGFWIYHSIKYVGANTGF